MSSNAMTIEGKTVLVTGANRGLGQALVDEALRRGARAVYAASRQPIVHPDDRVRPVIMDVTEWAQIKRAAESVDSLDILINNAGVSLPDDLSDRSRVRAALRRQRLRPVDGCPGDAAVADPEPGADRKRRLARGVRRGAGPSGLFGLEGGGVLGDAVAARAPGRARREGSCRPARTDRYRHGAGSRYPRKRRPRTSPVPRSTEWSAMRATPSPTGSRRWWPRTGARARPRRLSARTRRSSQQNRSRRRHGRTAGFAHSENCAPRFARAHRHDSARWAWVERPATRAPIDQID